MKKENIIILVLIGSLALRYAWAKLGWAGETWTLYPPLITLMILLFYYHNQFLITFYKVITLFLAIYILSILFYVSEWKGGGLLLFIGSLGFLMFAFEFLVLHKKTEKSHVFPYCIALCIILVIQTIIYLFISTSMLLSFAHMLCYGILILAGLIVFKKRLRNEISGDEKMILTFIIIVNILSLMGVTFKESFYSSIWI